jgi:hypothetical protein
MCETNNSVDPRWKDLYRLGGYFSYVAMALIIWAIAAFLIWPYLGRTATAGDIFTLFQKDLAAFLFSLDIVMLFILLVHLIPLLALYVSLKPVNESYALIAMVLGLVAIIAFVNLRPVAELASLSEKYAQAESEALKDHLLAAGEAILVTFDGTAWMVQTVFLALSGLISSVLMLKSPFFSRFTAWVGIISSAFGLTFFLPVIGIPLLLLSTVGSILWYPLIGRSFLLMSRR